ncbi:MAG: glycosyltransferase, partial [Methanophagales archaeon]|nr:glycosyltransferase [Methanophagales archaeon]
MKIFMVCDVLLDGRGAQATHIVELFKNLAKLSDTYLFVPKHKKPMNEVQSIIFVPSVMPVYKSVFYQAFLFFYLIYYCFKLFPDILYTRQYTLNFSPFFISKFFRISYVIEVNGLLIDEIKMGNEPKSYIRIRIAKLSEKLNYKHAKKIVAVTQGVKEGIMELYNIPDEKIVVIENGANTDLFKPIDLKEAKKELKLKENYNYVGFSGSFAP